MDKQILNFTVNEQILVCENPIKISTNKVNYIQANFDLGENWDGFDSVRAVWFNDFNCISTVLDSLGNCVVPFEVMKRKGNVKINLVGSISEDDVLTDRLTSYPVVAVIVDCTAQIVGSNTSPITPSEYEQFVAAVHEDAERAEAGATASEQSATESANSASASAESAQEAEAHASSAQIYAGIASNEAEASANSASEAQAYAQNASESATDAEGYAEDAESARDTILGMRATANTLSEGSDATASYSNGLLTLGIPRGNTGATGPTGPQGETGATPNLSIGTVTTLDPDEDATATISGTAKNPVLSFGIPKGDTGEVSLSELEDATIVQTLSDSEPYNYRRTNNGNGAGVREYDEIVGASVGWNQLVNTTDTSVTIQSGHKYYSNINNVKTIGLSNGTAISINDGTKDNIIDLTLFNSQIADYVYSLEQSTAGSGAAWLKTHFPKLFDNGYQPFDSGSIKSVSGLTAHEMVGVNLADTTKWFWNLSYNPNIGATVNTGVGNDVTDNGDGTFSFPNASWRNRAVRVKVEAGQTYYVSGTLTQKNDGFVGWFVTDENDVVISKVSTYGTSTFYSNVVTPPSGAKWLYIQFGDRATGSVTTNVITEPMVTFGSTATPYEPYIKHAYPLDSSVTLRGQYKLNNGQLYAVGDVYESDGTVTRKYGIVDLGTLTWGEYGSTDTITQYYTTGLDALAKPFSEAISDVGYYSQPMVANTVYISRPSGMVYVRTEKDKYASPAAFKTAMSGHYLVYELATPTTESAEPYTNPQIVDDFGTEEYVGSELPVGHNTDYPMTMVDCADGLGNGTYTPKLTVTNGKLTFEWQSV